MLYKKGQAAAGAAILLAIIAATLVMFIILIPPQERAELLEENYTSSSSSSSTSSSSSSTIVGKELLVTNPGRIDYLAQNKLEHQIPIVTIYTKEESNTLAEKSFISVKKGAFAEKIGDIRFLVEDTQNTKNVVLGFDIKSITGNVLIYLNGEEIAERSESEVSPINIPTNLLQKENIITFMSESPGVAFWQTNAATFNDIKVVADITNVGAQSSRSVFIVGPTEKTNLKSTRLRFQPDCVLSDVGRLRVLLNDKEIYNAVPDCALKMIPIEFSPEQVHQGDNVLEFRTEKGTYQLNGIVIESELKEVDFPTYYFEVSQEEFDAVKNKVKKNKKVELELRFVDVSDNQQGDILFNGHMSSFDTKEYRYRIDVSDDIVKGNNAVKIKPKKTLEVRELVVELVDNST